MFQANVFCQKIANTMFACLVRITFCLIHMKILFDLKSVSENQKLINSWPKASALRIHLFSSPFNKNLILCDIGASRIVSHLISVAYYISTCIEILLEGLSFALCQLYKNTDICKLKNIDTPGNLAPVFGLKKFLELY